MPGRRPRVRFSRNDGARTTRTPALPDSRRSLHFTIRSTVRRRRRGDGPALLGGARSRRRVVCLSRRSQCRRYSYEPARRGSASTRLERACRRWARRFDRYGAGSRPPGHHVDRGSAGNIPLCGCRGVNITDPRVSRSSPCAVSGHGARALRTAMVSCQSMDGRHRPRRALSCGRTTASNRHGKWLHLREPHIGRCSARPGRRDGGGRAEFDCGVVVWMICGSSRTCRCAFVAAPVARGDGARICDPRSGFGGYVCLAAARHESVCAERSDWCARSVEPNRTTTC